MGDVKIEERLLTPNKYSRPCTPIGTVRKIVLHWVGNANSTAINNRNYFESLKDKKIYASSHYIIGLQGEVILCVPEEEVAYHGNDANSYSIGVENCHPDWGGKFNDETYKSLIELCADLCKRYGLNPMTDIIRHYDITKKDCPSYYVKNYAEFDRLKGDVKTALYNVDDEYKKAVETLSMAGIIGSPTAWDIDRINIKNVPSLIKKMANYINK